MKNEVLHLFFLKIFTKNKQDNILSNTAIGPFNVKRGQYSTMTMSSKEVNMMFQGKFLASPPPNWKNQ